MKADVTIEGFGLIHAEIVPTESAGKRGYCCMVRIKEQVFSTILFVSGFAHDHNTKKPNWEMLKKISGPGLETLETIVRAIKEKELQKSRVLKQRELLKKTLKASQN